MMARSDIRLTIRHRQKKNQTPPPGKAKANTSAAVLIRWVNPGKSARHYQQTRSKAHSTRQTIA